MKVYVIVGCHSVSCDIYSSVSKYGVKSTLKDAQKELEIIKQETIDEYEENGLDADNLDIRQCADELVIIYGNDDFEKYTIHEIEIDYK